MLATILTDVASIIQWFAILSACWAIISGVGAWKREFLGKRQIELAEQVLAKFFEIKDAIAYIRNPMQSHGEGKTRQRDSRETELESGLLDRGYVVIERYQEKEAIFSQFNTLKYRFMATFGPQSEEIFADTSKVLNSIFASARLLATHYWPRQGRVPMTQQGEFQKHLEGMQRHEGIFWDTYSDTDEIRAKLQEIQERLEKVTAPCFREPMKSYSLLTKPVTTLLKLKK